MAKIILALMTLLALAMADVAVARDQDESGDNNSIIKEAKSENDSLDSSRSSGREENPVTIDCSGQDCREGSSHMHDNRSGNPSKNGEGEGNPTSIPNNTYGRSNGIRPDSFCEPYPTLCRRGVEK